MFQSLHSFLRKQNYLPHNLSSNNVFIFTDSATFTYKLTNWAMWYIYVTDSLHMVTLRVYNKNWNKVFMVSFFSYSIIIILLMLI